MSGIKLKICGLVRKDNIQEVASVRPDYMGFIFYEGSPRNVGEKFVLPDKLDASIQKVGVFVNEKINAIREKVKLFNLDLVQLHGEESPLDCKQLEDWSIKVIKAFSVDSEFDFEKTNSYKDYVDYFLFDTKGQQRGGNGIPFDWNLLNNYKGNIPFFLSGGIDSDNVGQIRQLNHDKLFAIDVNSGIEKQPGIKSIAKLDELMVNFKE